MLLLMESSSESSVSGASGAIGVGQEAAEDADVSGDGGTHGSAQSDDGVAGVPVASGMGLATGLGVFGVDLCLLKRSLASLCSFFRRTLSCCSCDGDGGDVDSDGTDVYLVGQR